MSIAMRAKGNTAKTPPEPYTAYAVAQQHKKGEDVLFIIPDLSSLAPRKGLAKWAVYAVCDGHGGIGAARFVRKNLGRALVNTLPRGQLPPACAHEHEQFCRSVRRALVTAFIGLQDAFRSEGYQTSGTTLTVCLLCDWLLTVANVADSLAFLDCGGSVMELTKCHRIDNSKREIARLQQGGTMMARLSSVGPGPASSGDPGRGPLRIWPGGITMSRSLGDLESDPHIVPVPHIRQMWAPTKGSRLIMASDGLWDYVSGIKACRIVHRIRLKEAPMQLLQAAEASSSQGLRDDISILVLDILPRETDYSSGESSMRALKSLGMMLRRSRSFRKARISSLLANEDGLIDHSDVLDDIVLNICTASISEDDSDEDIYSRSFSLGSDNWDVREARWDCSLDSSIAWEKDDRDILDTAEVYSSSSHPSSCLKMITNRPRQDPIDQTDLMDQWTEAATAHHRPTMSTIYEPDLESPQSMQE